jgi:hypothetical protein
MNSSPGRASQPPSKVRRKDVSLDYATSRRMLPLVRGIVSDIVDTTRRIDRLVPELETLDEHRRALIWASRERRYQVQDDVAKAERQLAEAVSELDTLGVQLVDGRIGQVEFPTRMNGRPAAYSWQLGEDVIAFWKYLGEDLRRPVPDDYLTDGVASKA